MEAKRQIDGWVEQHLPSQVMVDARVQEVAHAKRFLAEYGRAVGQFEVELAGLVGNDRPH